MITIIVETRPEYVEMLEFAKNCVCKCIDFEECAKYPPLRCDDCYKDHHLKCGIRVIDPLDNTKPNEL